jgi:DNA repair exonuclease SbcCD nuclease subunit
VKIAILADTHFGARSDSPVFLEHFMRFYKRVFFPRLQAEGITTIIHLGDFLDRRKFVNFATLNAVRTGFIQELWDNKLEMHCILGNHDIFYKNRSDVNSPRELFYDAFTVYEKPTVLQFGSAKIAMLPWINKENEAESMEFVRTCDAEILCGHLELDGFQVMRNSTFQGGMKSDPFARFKAVYTGHFHTRHSRDNIHYLGCPYQITMSDYGEKKGFHILDTESGELEFVVNPHNIFTKITYDDSALEQTEMLTVPEERVRGHYVRVVVEKKTKPYLFEKFVDSLYGMQPEGVTIIDSVAIDNQSETDTVDLTEDTLATINKEIDSMDSLSNAQALKDLVRELYVESLNQNAKV